MARKKKNRIAEVVDFPNVAVDPVDIRTMLSAKGLFVLEVGCGAGEYTIALAQLFPDKQFIGMDQKADRIWRAAKSALALGLKNVHFINDYVENLDEYFNNGQISEIWITFPDPYSKPSKADRRLTSPRFLAIYRRALVKGGVIHLKTDNIKLFEYSVETFKKEKWKISEEIRDVHGHPKIPEILKTKTHYEEKFEAQGHKIYYAAWSYFMLS